MWCTTDRALSPVLPWRTSSIVAIVLGALATPAAAVPVTDGLVGYWAGDGDGLDSSSSANHLSL